MYAVAAEAVWGKHGEHLAGCRAGLWCVVSSQPLGQSARQALAKSAAALGYGETSCTYVALDAPNANAECAARTMPERTNDVAKPGANGEGAACATPEHAACAIPERAGSAIPEHAACAMPERTGSATKSGETTCAGVHTALQGEASLAGDSSSPCEKPERAAEPNGAACGRTTAENRKDARGIGGEELFAVIEGLDPLCVVAGDATGAQALANAYQQSVPLDAHCRLFGRDAVAFRSFESLLGSAESKQRAWALLKKLPRLG